MTRTPSGGQSAPRKRLTLDELLTDLEQQYPDPFAPFGRPRPPASTPTEETGPDEGPDEKE